MKYRIEKVKFKLNRCPQKDDHNAFSFILKGRKSIISGCSLIKISVSLQ